MKETVKLLNKLIQKERSLEIGEPINDSDIRKVQIEIHNARHYKVMTFVFFLAFLFMTTLYLLIQ